MMRVGIFFDGKNFHSGWKDATSGHDHPDFDKLAQWITARAGGGVLWGAYYYTGTETGERGQSNAQVGLDRFLKRLETVPGYFVRRFPRKLDSYRCQSCSAENRFTREKEVDTTMVADMLRLAAVDAFDVLVLVSGDADHAPAADGVRALGKQVYVASWGGYGLSMRLRQVAYDHIDLTQGVGEFMRPRPKAEAPATTGTEPDDGRSVFVRELKRAQLKFSGGYVGANFFVTRWKGDEDFDDASHVRRRILDSLVKDDTIEMYTASDGSQAIRIKE